jgi:hypothetical protein
MMMTEKQNSIVGEYRQCTMSVMDNIADADIVFDEKGVCNYYYEYLNAEKTQVFYGDKGEQKFAEVIRQIKAEIRLHPWC